MGQLGTSKIYSVFEFVNWALQQSKINYEVRETEDQLRIWNLDGGRQIIEKERNISDSKRIMMADRKKVIKVFGENKLTYGEELVRILFKEYDKYSNYI